jgi:hypothetical protein
VQYRNRQSLGDETGVGLNLQPVDGYHPAHAKPAAAKSFANGRSLDSGIGNFHFASTAVGFGVTGWVHIDLR